MFSVETSHLTRPEQIAACGAALDVVRERADRLQIDVPWDHAASWPEEVVEAASVFAPRRRDYECSGWIAPISQRQWLAFRALAPYAFSSDVWTADMRLLADVNDEGSSITVHVESDDLSRLREAVAPAYVVELKR